MWCVNYVQSLTAALYVRGHRNQLERDRETALASLTVSPSPDRLFTLYELQNRLAQWSLSDESIRLHREATLLKSSISRVMNTSLDSLQEYTHQLSSISDIVSIGSFSRTEYYCDGICDDVRSCSVCEVPSSNDECDRASSSGDFTAILLVEADRSVDSTL